MRLRRPSSDLRTNRAYGSQFSVTHDESGTDNYYGLWSVNFACFTIPDANAKNSEPVSTPGKLLRVIPCAPIRAI